MIGLKAGHCYVKSWKEPAGIISWNLYPLTALLGLGYAIGGYARFIRGYNNLWFVAGFVPFWAYAFYNYCRQPTVELENCYRYLLAKRAATCELQANQRRFNENAFTQSEEFGKLRGILEARNITLYQLEHELIDKINSGNFK